MDNLERFEKEFWQQYPIDQYVCFDGELIREMLLEVQNLQIARNQAEKPAGEFSTNQATTLPDTPK